MDPVNPDDRSEPAKKTPTPKIVFESEYDRNPLSFLSKPWVQKTAFWVLLLGVLIYARSFFSLIFLTFLFSILMEAVVRRTPNLIPPRRGRVVMVFILLLASWTGLFYYLVPRIATEFDRTVTQLPKLADDIRKQIDKLRPEDGDELEEEAGEETAVSPGEEQQDREPPPAAERPAANGQETGTDPDADESTKKKGERTIWELVYEALALDEALAPEKVKAFFQRVAEDLAPKTLGVINHLLWAVTVFLLSLIFSFLIVWDFPRLVGGYYKLEQTRGGPFFQVARETFSPFGKVLAQALGAQTVIALANTALTAIGMAILEVPAIEVLSVIVFLCSFIPVAGVFISSTPICIVALGNNGFGNMLLFVVVVTIVHIIEAYILNPRIYGAHLRMNPLVVLVLLVVAHHVLGLWGLLLATPVTAYIFHHVLKFPEKQAMPPEEGDAKAAAET
jgi:predicted PurR-regulated permease PerM